MNQMQIDQKDAKFIELIEKYKEFQEVIMNLSQIRNCMIQAQYMIENESTSIPIDMTKESGYISLIEMDNEEFQVKENIQEQNAPTHSLDAIILNYTKQYEIFLTQVEQENYKFMANTYNEFKSLRLYQFELVHDLRQQMVVILQYLENQQNTNGFPLNLETYEQLYSLIASFIMKNITTKEKLMNVTYEYESLHSLDLLVRFVKIKPKIFWNHYFIVMNTFALQLQNITLHSKFLTSLFFSELYFNIASIRVDQEVTKLKFNTFIRMHRVQFESQEHDLDSLFQNDEYFQKSFTQFQHMEQNHSDLIGTVNKTIIPHLQYNWSAIKQDVADLLLKVGQSSRFKQGIKSFKNFYSIQGHIDIKPFWLINIHFYYVSEELIQGFTIMNGDIIINLKILAQIYNKNENIDISQIFKALVLYLLIHEYAHILIRRSLNDWQFQTTQLGEKQAVESQYPKESGEIFEIILFGLKLYEKSDQSAQSSSIEFDSNQIQSMRSGQKLISNIQFLKEILDYNYWSLPVRRKYPISENIITTIACLNEFYELDQIKFRQMFEQSASQNSPNSVNFAEFLKFVWSTNNSIAEYKIKETFNYIDWENKQIISYYMITIALQLDQRNDVIE